MAIESPAINYPKYILERLNSDEKRMAFENAHWPGAYEKLKSDANLEDMWPKGTISRRDFDVLRPAAQRAFLLRGGKIVN